MVFFTFFQILNIILCKPTVKILLRHRIMRCLIWVCTVSLCPIERALDLYGLTENIFAEVATRLGSYSQTSFTLKIKLGEVNINNVVQKCSKEANNDDDK